MKFKIRSAKGDYVLEVVNRKRGIPDDLNVALGKLLERQIANRQGHHSKRASKKSSGGSARTSGLRRNELEAKAAAAPPKQLTSTPESAKNRSSAAEKLKQRGGLDKKPTSTSKAEKGGRIKDHVGTGNKPKSKRQTQ